MPFSIIFPGTWRLICSVICKRAWASRHYGHQCSRHGQLYTIPTQSGLLSPQAKTGVLI